MRRGLMSKTFVVVAAILAVSLIWPLGCAPEEKPPIKVGIVDTYTGAPTTYTYDVRDSFKLVIDKVNAEGGVLGRQIEYFCRDDKFKVDLALSVAKELVMDKNVDILMGTINSACSLALAEYVETEKIPFLVTFAKSVEIVHKNDYVFMMNENTEMAGKAGAIGLAGQNYTKYWIAGDDYEYGHAIADGVWNNLKALKPEVELIGQSWWTVGEPDFTPYMTAILAADPDAVIIATGAADCVPFLKAAKTTGFAEQVPIYMHTATELSTLEPLGSDAPEGVWGTANFPFAYPGSPLDTAENRAFYETFHDAYGRYPKVGALYGYIAANFIVKALEEAGEVDSEKFIAALEGLEADSPIGTLKMRAEDHQVMLPMYWGTTCIMAEYPFLVACNITTIPAEEVWP